MLESRVRKTRPGSLRYADVAQVVAHILGKDEVMGPNPIISSNPVQ